MLCNLQLASLFTSRADGLGSRLPGCLGIRAGPEFSSWCLSLSCIAAVQCAVPLSGYCQLLLACCLPQSALSMPLAALPGHGTTALPSNTYVSGSPGGATSFVQAVGDLG